MSTEMQKTAAEIETLLQDLATSRNAEQINQLAFKSYQVISSLDPAVEAHRLHAQPLAELVLDRILLLVTEGMKGGNIVVALTFLAGPTIKDRWLHQVPSLTAWQNLYTTALDEISRRPSDFGVLLLLLTCEGLLFGRDQALTKFSDRLSQVNFVTSPEIVAPLNALGNGFSLFGWMDDPSPEFGRSLEAGVERQIGFGPVSFSHFLYNVLTMWRLDVNSSSAWLACLTQYLAAPALKVSAEHASLSDLVLYLDRLMYLVNLKKIDTAANFKALYATIGPLLAAAGERLARAHPLPQRTARAAHERPRIGFFIWGDFTTAHASALLLLLRAVHRLDPCPLQLYVLVLDRPGANLQYLLDAVADLDVAVRWQQTPTTSVTDDILWMRRQAAEDELDGFVFISVTMMMCFMAGLGMAPVHIWWTLKYHDLYLPQIQGYLAQGLFGRLKLQLGANWTIAEVCVPELTDLSLAPEAARLAHEHSEGVKYVLLGCMGRAEKIIDPRYGKSLARILRACPQAKFLYTGRGQRPEFLRMMEEEGIADRCHFIGWINTKLYAQVLDVQVDSFPFASGITSMQMMAVGRPVVTMITAESMETSAATYFVPVHHGEIGTAEDQAFVRILFTDDDGSSIFPFLETADAYEALTIRLAHDARLRSRIGAGCRAFIERYMRNEERYARSAAHELTSIVTRMQHPSPEH